MPNSDMHNSYNLQRLSKIEMESTRTGRCRVHLKVILRNALCPIFNWQNFCFCLPCSVPSGSRCTILHQYLLANWKEHNILLKQKLLTLLWINGFQVGLAFQLESLPNFFTFIQIQHKDERRITKNRANSNKYQQQQKRHLIDSTTFRAFYCRKGFTIYQKTRCFGPSFRCPQQSVIQFISFRFKLFGRIWHWYSSVPNHSQGNFAVRSDFGFGINSLHAQAKLCAATSQTLPTSNKLLMDRRYLCPLISHSQSVFCPTLINQNNWKQAYCTKHICKWQRFCFSVQLNCFYFFSSTYYTLGAHLVKFLIKISAPPSKRNNMILFQTICLYCIKLTRARAANIITEFKQIFQQVFHLNSSWSVIL